jgi:hypothetical protein
LRLLDESVFTFSRAGHTIRISGIRLRNSPN